MALDLSALNIPSPSTRKGVDWSKVFSGKVTGGVDWSSVYPSGTQSSLTPLQMVEQYYLAKEKRSEGDLLHQIAKGGKASLASLLNLISRPSWAIAEASKEALKPGGDIGDVLSGALRGIEGKAHTNFGEVLKQQGVLSGHGIQRGILGFGLDVATDPLNLLFFGSGSVLKSALKEGAEAGMKTAVKSGLTKEEYATALKGLEPFKTELPSTYKLADMQHELASMKQAGVAPPIDFMAMYTGVQAQAFQEAKKVSTKYFQARVKIPFARIDKTVNIGGKPQKIITGGAINLHPATIGKYGLKTPTLARAAEGKMLVQKLPIVGPATSKTAQFFAEHFTPGFGNELFHALNMNAEKVKAEQTRKILDRVHVVMRPFKRKGRYALSPEQQLAALHWAEEQADKLVKEIPAADAAYGGLSHRILNIANLSKAVREGAIDESPRVAVKKARFIRAWHEATEELRVSDWHFGVKYDAPLGDKIYVPHLFLSGGDAAAPRVFTMLTKAGFKYPREVSGVNQSTFADLVKIRQDSGLHKQVVTDPLELLAMRSRRGAQEQASEVLNRSIAHTLGIPTHLTDEARLAELGAKAQKLHDDRLIERTRINPKTGKTIVARQTNYGLDSIARLLGGELDEALEHRLDLLREQHGLTHEGILAANADEIHKLTKEINQIRASIKSISTRKEGVILSNKAVKAAMAPNHISRVSQEIIDSFKPVIKRDAQGRAVKLSPEEILFNQARQRIYKAAPELRRRAAVAKKFNVRKNAEKGTLGVAAHGSKFSKMFKQFTKEVYPTTSPADAASRKTMLEAAVKRNKQERLSWNTLLDLAIKEQVDYVQLEWKKISEPYNAIISNSMKTVPRSRKAHAGILAQKEKKLLRLINDTPELSNQASVVYQKNVNKLLVQHNNQIARLTKRQENLVAQEEKLQEQSQRALSSLINPMLKDRPDLKELTRLVIPVIRKGVDTGATTTIHVSEPIYKAMTRIQGAVNDEDALYALSNTYRRLVSKWKVGATIVNPGYRVRNTLSDLWNMYIMGVPVWAMGVYGAKAANHIFTDIYSKNAVKREAAAELMSEAYHHGILSGLYEGDIQIITQYLRSGTGRAKTLAEEKHYIAAATRAMGEFNRHAENWGRLTHYLYNRDYLKLSVAESASKVKTAHFDYEDLTDLERKIKTNLIPFYTWTRKNIPFQLQQLATRPGKYSAFPKAMSEANTAAGEEDPNTIIPSFLKKNMAFRTPFGYMTPQIGVLDLAKVDPSQGIGNIVQQWTGMLNPALKAPIELITNKNLGTGQPIQGGPHERNPVNLHGLDSLFKLIPGSNIGRTERTVNGKQVGGTGASPLLTYAAGQLPMTNFLFNQSSNIRKAQRGKDPGYGYLAGFALYNPDQDQQRAIALLKWQDKMSKRFRMLKDINVLDESVKKDSPYEKMLLQQISKLNSIGGG